MEEALMKRVSALRIVTLGGVLLMGGCAAQMLSDDRLGDNTAGVLGVPASELTLSDRVEKTPNTYYTATTKDGRKFSCLVNGGGIMAAGMVNPPSCVPKGQPLRDTNPLASR
jgi:hypothetical protein